MDINLLTKNLKALANKRRLVILKLLMSERELNVHTIAERIGLSMKSTSKHIKRLEECEMVFGRQVRVEVYYSLNRTHLMFKQLSQFLK